MLQLSIPPQLDGRDLYGEVCLATPTLTKIEVELEADRQGICDALLRREQDDRPGKDPRACKVPHATKPLPASSSMTKSCKALSKYSTLPAVTASTYVLDFGNVVKGTVVCKTFKIQNTCISHAFVSADKDLLAAFGCTLHPDKLLKLPGLPERSCTEIQLSLNTQSPQVPPGPMEFHAPLYVQNGPPILVNVKACVAIPDLICDQNELSFGTVSYGMGRVLTIILSNTGIVPAEWSVKKPADVGASQNWTSFLCDPAAGVVDSNSFAKVKVIYIPQQPGRNLTPCNQDIYLKVASGRTISLHVSGTSFMSKVKISPKEVDLGVTMPGGQPAQAEIQLSNPGLSPIEVCAMDFDVQWSEEENFLSAWNGYHEDWGIALLKPRGVCTGIWEHVREDVQHKTPLRPEGLIQSVRHLTQGPAPSDIDPEAHIHVRKETVAHHTPVFSTTPRSFAGVEQGTNGLGKPFIAIVSCIDAAIASQQAQMLAVRYAVPCTTLDDLILDAGELEHTHEVTGTVFGDMMYEDLIGWEGAKELTLEHPRPYLSVHWERRDQVVELGLITVLKQPKYNSGFVLMGTECEFSPVATKALMQAIETIISLESIYVIDLHFDLYSSQQRYLDTLSKAKQGETLQRIEEQRALIAKAAAASVTSNRSKKTSSKRDGPTDMPQYPEGIDPLFGDLYDRHTARVNMCKNADGHGESQCIPSIRIIKMDNNSPSPIEIHNQVIGLNFDLDFMTLALPTVQVQLSVLFHYIN